MKSVIYWHPVIYRSVIRILYGKKYAERYELIAKEVGHLEVMDLCCGDCKLASYVKNYKGIDSNKIFVKHARKKGLDVKELDIVVGDIPKAECIVMQGSLCQFIPNHEAILKRILDKGGKVIISEAGVHVASSKNPIISLVARKLTRTSIDNPYRFSKEELVDLFKKFKANKIIETGREIIGVFEPR